MKTWLFAGVALALLGLVAWASLSFGTLAQPGEAGSYGEAVVWDLRWPRTLTGFAVGAALAAAGCLMQALTRNPLADPSILGVNAGSALAIVLAVVFFRATDPTTLFLAALVGGAGAAGLVWALGAGGPAQGSPVRLTLAGVILTSLLASWTSALLLQDNQALNVVRTWLTGSLGGRDLVTLGALAPWLAAGCGAALLLARPLEVLGLGQDKAQTLGLRTGLVRTATLATVVGLTAVAVALAGPVGFVGLAVPHLARGLAGPHLTHSLPLALVLGPLLLVGADVVGRVVLPPSELPVGLVTAVLGAPLLIVLALRMARR